MDCIRVAENTSCRMVVTSRPPAERRSSFTQSEVVDDLLIYGVKRLQNATGKLESEKIAVCIRPRPWSVN